MIEMIRELRCDHCPSLYDGPGFDFATSIRAWAKSDNWLRKWYAPTRRYIDVCPKCAKKYYAKKKSKAV